MGRKSLRRDTNPWGRFKVDVITLIIEALRTLRTRTDLVRDEKKLNRLLSFCFVEANAHLKMNYLPAYEAKNSPHPEDKEKTRREDQIPDFSWNIMDHTASYPHWQRNFALECKWLGQETSKNWVLTEQYVMAGMLRFFLAEKGYGKGCEVGAMVGYMQDMEFDEILQEVNSHISQCSIHIPQLIAPVYEWQVQDVSYILHSSLKRMFIPEEFALHHFWLDMRGCIFSPEEVQEKTNLLLSKNIPNDSVIEKMQEALPPTP